MSAIEKYIITVHKPVTWMKTIYAATTLSPGTYKTQRSSHQDSIFIIESLGIYANIHMLLNSIAQGDVSISIPKEEEEVLAPLSKEKTQRRILLDSLEEQITQFRLKEKDHPDCILLDSMIDDVRMFIENIPSTIEIMPTVKIHGDGEVVLEWNLTTRRQVMIHFEGDGYFNYYMKKRVKDFFPGEEEGRISNPFPNDLLEYLETGFKEKAGF